MGLYIYVNKNTISSTFISHPPYRTDSLSLSLYAHILYFNIFTQKVLLRIAKKRSELKKKKKTEKEKKIQRDKFKTKRKEIERGERHTHTHKGEF